MPAVAAAEPAPRSRSTVPASQRIATLEEELERQRVAREDDEKALGEMLARIADGERARRDLETRNRALAARVETLEAEVAREAAAPDETGALVEARARIAALEAAVTEADGRTRAMTDQRDGFERAIRAAAVRERESTESAARVSVQRDGFERAAVEAMERARSVEKKLAELERSARDLRARAEAAETALDDASERTETAERTKNELQLERDVAAQRLARIERESVELAAELADRAARAEEAARQATEADDRARTQEKRASAATAELASEREAREEVEGHVAALERELALVGVALRAAEKQSVANGLAGQAAAKLLDELAQHEERIHELRVKTVDHVRSVLGAAPVTVAPPPVPVRKSVSPESRSARRPQSIDDLSLHVTLDEDGEER